MEVNLKALGALAENILADVRKARERKAPSGEPPGEVETALEEQRKLRGYVLEGGPEQRMPEGK